MKRFTFAVLPLVFLVMVMTLMSCMKKPAPTVYHDPAPAPPVPHATDLWISVENSAAMKPALDAFPDTVRSLLTRLHERLVDYRVIFIRSSENADGNYDARPQGPTPIVSAADADPVGEALADLAYLRSQHLGTAPMPLEMLARAATATNEVPTAGRHTLLLAFAANDSAQYFSQNGVYTSAAQTYRQQWDWCFGTGNWRTFYWSTGLEGNMRDGINILSITQPLSLSIASSDGDQAPLADAILNWQ